MRAAAEDLAQDVLMLLHEKYPRVTALEELVPLGMRILRFKLTAGLRKAQRRGEDSQRQVEELQLPDAQPSPEALAHMAETRKRLVQAIGKLGARCRRIFALKVEGRSFAEIKTILNAASLNTVYTWDLRCRRELLARLGGQWER